MEARREKTLGREALGREGAKRVGARRMGDGVRTQKVYGRGHVSAR